MGGWSTDGAGRAATACLVANGGFAVVLRMPGQAVSGSDAEQMGLGTPQFADVPVGPAVWRGSGEGRYLLLAASALTEAMQVQAADSAEALLASAVGVVIDGVLYGITRCAALGAAGEAFAYRIEVEAPVWV